MTSTASVVRRAPSSSGLYDVLDLILDKGLVIDAFVRVSLVGIELLTVDLRVVVASVDTYLRFAEAVDRLALHEQGGMGLGDLGELGGNASESLAKRAVHGALEGGKQSLKETFTRSGDKQEDKQSARDEES